MGYQTTDWKDHVAEFENRYTETANSDGTITHQKVEGEIIQQGTPLSATYLLNMEFGIKDAHIAVALLNNALQQLGWRADALEKATVQETGTITLTNSQKFPFNNSQISVALANRRDNLNYIVVIIDGEDDPGIGEIKITDRQVNGFKIGFTGSAKSAEITYAVIGGYN